MPINAPYHSSMGKEIQKAANIINSFFNNSTVDADSSIPAELIKNCAGLAFLTVVKAGMIWTGKVGTGIVLAKLEDGSWSAPSGIGTAGIGFGAEIGGEIVDFMIVLGSRSAVKTFTKGTQVSVGAGLELAVGPMGRAAGANVNAGSGGLGANYTYSRAKGAFAGVGLSGSTIMVRGEMNAKFYGRDVSPAEILGGHVQAPAGSCDMLYEAITMAQGKEGLSVYPSTDPRSSSYGAGNGSSYNNAYGSQRSSSFEHNHRSSFNSTGSGSGSGSSSAAAAAAASRGSLSAPTTAQPSGDDPRLKRYSTYKSERELYDQYAKSKSPAAAASTTATTQGYGAGYGGGYGAPVAAAAAAPVAVAAAASYGAGYGGSSYGYSSAPAPAASYASAPPAVAAPAATPAAPTRLAYKTVPASTYVPNYNSQTSSSSSTSSSHSSASYSLPGARASQMQAPAVPPPAVGAETKQVYTHVIGFVSSKCPHANVQIFKDNCRLFGQDQMSLDAYFAYLTSICTTPLLKELVPQLVRLLPTQDKRQNLWTIYVQQVLMIR